MTSFFGRRFVWVIRWKLTLLNVCIEIPVDQYLLAGIIMLVKVACIAVSLKNLAADAQSG